MKPSSALPEAHVSELRDSLNALATVIQSVEVQESLNKLRSMTSVPLDLQHMFVNRSFKLPR